MDEPFLQMLSLPAPMIWVVISIVSSLIIALIRHRLSSRQQRWIDNIRWILLPYVGLLLGQLSPSLLGLTEIDWFSSLSLGTGFICLTAFLIMLVQGSSTVPAQSRASQMHKRLQRTFHQNATISSLIAELIVSTGAEQFYWSFLRGALWEVFLRAEYSAATAKYLGIWTAGLIATIELLLYNRHTISRLAGLLTLIVTTILFFYTKNFWLCWLLHFIVTTMLQQRRSTIASH